MRLACAQIEVGGDEGPADEGYANTSVLFGRDGERLDVYRNHHLFGYESVEAGLLSPARSSRSPSSRGSRSGRAPATTSGSRSCTGD